jgi:predicted HTH domain antitoxin
MQGDMFMTTITINVPDSFCSALHIPPEHFESEMRTAAAIKWYEQGKISQGKGAEIAGLSRSEFITALSEAQVSPFQYTEKELLKESLDAN